MNPKFILDGKTVIFYSNAIQVGYLGGGEFLLDVCLFQGFDNIHVDARIISSPSHVKRLISVLATKLREYEEKFGEVQEDVKPRVVGEVVFEKKEN